MGAGGTGRFYAAGDYVEQAYARSTSATKLDLTFKMVDFTDYTWCYTGTLAWKVMVNGTQVGTYSWVAGYSFGADKPITKSYTFGAIAPVSGMFTLRMESTTAVCSGGGSWNWYAGGTATLQ